jgi:predicted enzyme related to lactoylglutathione lyase
MSEKEEKHEIYGGSNAVNWVNCYGYISLEQQLGDECKQEPGPAAIEGSRLHKICEKFVKTKINHLLEGTSDVNESEYTAEDLEFAKAYYQAVFDGALEGIVTGKKILVERKVYLSKELSAGGIGDILTVYYNDKAELVLDIVDLKTGRIVVEPDHEQFLYYLVCAMTELEDIHNVIIDKGIAHVYQPSDTDEPFKTHIYKKAQLVRAKNKYLKAIAESRKENPKFKPGKWCEWCKLKLKCVEHNKYLSKNLDLDIAKLDTAPSIPDVETLPDDYIRRLIVHGPDFVELVKAAQKHGLKRFMSNNPIEGVKVIAGRSRRGWADPEDSITADSLKSLNVKPWKKVLIGIGDAEKQLGKDKKKLNSLVITKQTAPKIVAENAKGLAIDISNTSLLDGADELDEE